MTCEICKSKYDYNIHRPLIVKCGHTFCKDCIYISKQKYSNRSNNLKTKNIFICPIDNINHIFSQEKNINFPEPSIYPNLKLELIIKEIMAINEPVIKEKHIVYSKPDMKRNKSPEITNKNNINNREAIIQKDKKGKNENINIKINSGNQIINVNAINVNIDTGEKNKNSNTKKEQNDSVLNDDLNTLQINEEMNINDKKINFENDKINDDSIETIPYEEKSMTNMSFKDDFKELLNKNDEMKSQVVNNLNLKTDENKGTFSYTGIKKKYINNLNNNNNKNMQGMKAYNKKMLIHESNSSNNKNNIIYNKVIDSNRNNNEIVEDMNELKRDGSGKNSIYRNKKIKDLNSKNNLEKIINNDSLYDEDINSKDEKGYSSNNYYIKSNKNFGINQNKENNIYKKDQVSKNLNFDYITKLGTKSETKDILRKTDYHELSDNKKILNLKTLASNNQNNRQDIKSNVQSIKRESDKKNNISNNSIEKNESDDENFNKNYRKNRTVFRQKKKITYEKNLNNNTLNKLEENYKSESNQSLVDLKEKEKSEQINKYLFENSPNTFNKHSLVSKNIYISGKNNISNSMNKSNSSQNNFNLNINNTTKGRKLNFENNNNDDVFNVDYNTSNNNLYNNKRIQLSSSQRFKTINNSNSNKNLNNRNISSNHANNSNNSNSKINNSNNSNNNLYLEQNMMINSSYKKKSTRKIENNNNNIINQETPVKQEANNQNIISIYIKMKNKNKGDMNNKSGNKIDIDRNSLDPNNNSDIRDSRKNMFNLNNNIKINMNDYLSEKNYSNSLRETNNDSSPKNLKYSKESFIRLLTKQFESLLERENILKNSETYDKYKNYFSKMILSPYLSKLISENPISKIQITFLNRTDDLFIGILDQKKKEFITPEPISGILFTKKGEYYEGTFVNGQKEGQGKIIYKNGTIYEGSLKQNRHHGFGKLTQLDGEIFIGEWKEGKIHGNGKRYHSNGDKYVGNYVNNIRSGKGHYTFANGDSYEGNWSNGKANGKGKFIFKNGNVYEGEFKDNIISGKGTYTIKNGDIYIGNFINGLICGKGTLLNKNGNKYIGEFKNGKKEGEGSLYDKEGNIINSGIWVQDKFVN